MNKKIFGVIIVNVLVVLSVGAGIVPTISGNNGNSNLIDTENINTNNFSCLSHLERPHNAISACNAEKKEPLNNRFSPSGITLYVGGSGPSNYTKIQDGINAAQPGDTVFVYDDSSPYYEHVIIGKTITLLGENRETTVIDGNESGDVIYVFADWVNISGFTIQNSGLTGYPDYDAVIVVYSSHNTTIFENIIVNNNYGINLISSSYNTIIENNISIENSISYECGIKVSGSSHNNIITENDITNNYNGIYLRRPDSDYNEITNNSITNNVFGIYISQADHNIISRNTIAENNYGIYAEDGNYNIIHKNSINNNTGMGIYLYGSNVIIDGNYISYNSDCGIEIEGGYRNKIINNTISQNNYYGILLGATDVDTAHETIVYHNNIIWNTVNGKDMSDCIHYPYCDNQWDNGYPSGGNYWSDYQGFDFYQGPDQEIPGCDGIGDMSYEVPSCTGDCLTQDFYPIIHPFILGDMNVDGSLNFFDVDPFMLALNNPEEYRIQYGLLASHHGDINQDEVLDSLDIDPFVYRLIHQDYWPLPLNNPPYTPTSPEPFDGAIDVAPHADLSWTCGDPDPGDTLTYDVYFEANDPTPDILVSQGQATNEYDPGKLQRSTTYYWQIIAEDNPGAITPGPIWSFNTTYRIWLIETVDSIGDVGRYTSIALDSNNNPHISYYDTINYDLKYARWNCSSWHIETVDSVGEFIRHASIAVDSDDHPHICYYDSINYTNGNLKYAQWTGSSWAIEVIDTGRGIYCYDSIAVDSNNYPHIIYQRNGLKYAKWTGSSWAIENVTTGGSDFSIAVDSNNYPHISYNSARNLKYAKWTGSSWAIETVASGIIVQSTSIALDSNNYPHISYRKHYYADVRYARWTGSSWYNEIIDVTGDMYSNPIIATSIAVDSDDHPHISYTDTINWDLKYAMWNGSSWYIDIVDETGTTGCCTSIAVDSNNRPHISYWDYSNEDLKYTKLAGSISDLFKPMNVEGAFENNDKRTEDLDLSVSATNIDSPVRESGAITLFFGPSEGTEACETYTNQDCTYEIGWENGQATACLWAATENTDIWHGLALDFVIYGNCTISGGQMFMPTFEGGTLHRWHSGSDSDPTDGDIEGIAVYEQGLGAYPADDYGYLCGDVFLYKVAELTFSSDSNEPCDIFMAVGGNRIVKKGSPIGEPVYFGFSDDYVLGDDAGAMSATADLHITAAEIVGARSIAGSAGIPLDLYVHNMIENRIAAVQLFEFDLSREVNYVIAVTNIGIGATVSYIDSDTIQVLLDPPIPDMTWCTITLTGDAQDMITIGRLEGDTDGSGTVTTSDFSLIKPHFGKTVPDQAQPWFDTDGNGLVTIGDASIVKPRFGNSLS